MHIKEILINNYRSIKNLHLQLEPGKNIIVGKNNSGKSNIVKAIDLILGESSPTYAKTDNINENDFHKDNTKEPITIFLHISRNSDEELDYDNLYNCFGFYIHTEPKKYGQLATPILHQIDFNKVSNDIECLMNIDVDEVGNGKDYINPKKRKDYPLEDQFDDKFSFGLAFQAFMNEQGQIEKKLRLLYRENESSNWILSFSAAIRNELIQSAIIPAFRDPQNELRINTYSWFGKLLKSHIKHDDPRLLKGFQSFKRISDKIFESLKSAILENSIKVAFPGTEISFQFNPDTKVDIFKSVLIYFNDGFNSLLKDKGSGIQSIVTIGLFSYYTRNMSHKGSSLLAVEEPELYLHPQARKVLSDRFNEFLDGNKNQIIVTTHSPEFINSTKESLNLILIRKDQKKGTISKNTSFSNSKEKQILLKTQNSEMFFADFVLLVEGGDKFILEVVSSYYGIKLNTSLGKNWINENNYSIIAVGGKSEFWKYHVKLTELNIKHAVIADFDFLNKDLNEFFTKSSYPKIWKDKLNKIKSNSEYRPNKQLKNHSSKIIPIINNFITELHNKNIFILKNELENTYKPKAHVYIDGLSGKEEKAINLAINLYEHLDDLEDFLEIEDFKTILDKISK